MFFINTDSKKSRYVALTVMLQSWFVLITDGEIYETNTIVEREM